MVKTDILKIKGDWEEVVDNCRSTVSKPPLGKEPSKKFKRAILISEHSPIRCISVCWKWLGIPSWVATHFSRHKFEKFISTQRTDRTGVDRNGLPQDAPVIFRGEANTQSVIDVSRKRLCYTAAKETREQWEDFKRELHNTEPEIADVCVPNCIYRGGCCERDIGANCHFYENFLKRHPEITVNTSIQERYDIYNQEFYKDEQ